jgi:hypothetical protein
MLVSSPVKEGVQWTIIAGFAASKLEVVIAGYAMYSQLEVIWEGCCSFAKLLPDIRYNSLKPYLKSAVGML